MGCNQRSDVIASRVLHSAQEQAEVCLYSPVENSTDGCWKATVELKVSGQVVSHDAVGEDSFDSIIAGLRLARKLCEQHAKGHVRFANESEPWHWFPRIQTILDRTYELAVSQSMDDLHAEHCSRMKDQVADNGISYEWRSPEASEDDP